jgi:hypothetical protein
LRWDEYVEDVTEGIPDRRRAREVRRELRDHLESAAEAGVAEGLNRAEAEDRALASLGPMPVLARQFRLAHRVDVPVWPAIAGAVVALAGIGFILWPATGEQPGISVALLLWSALWAACHPRSLRPFWRDPRRVAGREELVALARSALPFAVAGALTAAAWVGLLNGGRAGMTIVPLVLVFPFLAWLLWEGARGLCLRRGAAGVTHPVGSGLAALALLLTLALTWGAEPRLGPAMPTAWSAIPMATLLAVLYFTGASILAHLHKLTRAWPAQAGRGLLPDA